MWLLSFYASAASFRLTTRSHQVRVAFMQGRGRQAAARLRGSGASRRWEPVLPGSLSSPHPDTKAALQLLLTFLAEQHTDSFHAALGSLPGDKAQELQAILGLT